MEKARWLPLGNCNHPRACSPSSVAGMEEVLERTCPGLERVRCDLHNVAPSQREKNNKIPFPEPAELRGGSCAQQELPSPIKNPNISIVAKELNPKFVCIDAAEKAAGKAGN